MSTPLPSLEDTISIYKNRFLIDLDDENDDTTLNDSIRGISSSSTVDDDSSLDLRTEHELDSSEARDSNRGRRSKLPKDLAGLMGQANVSFARGDYNDAILMCQEVIRLAPRCADPFISLAEHYLEIEDEEKAEQLYLIAAYLQPSNSHLWVKVAESATKRREFRLAATCFTKAIRADKNESCILYHLRRCNLYEKLGDQKKALRGYENLISILGPHDQEFGLELARGIARIYLSEDKIDSSIRTLEGTLEKYSNQLSGDDIAQLCHCYNIKTLFTKTIDTIIKKTSIKIELADGQEWELSRVNELIDKGEKVPIIIRLTDPRPGPRFTFRNKCLLLVAFIELRYGYETIGPLLPNLDNVDVRANRDCLFNVAQAYYNQNQFEQAKDILIKLTGNRDSQAAEVWLLYSRCLKNLNEIDEAIEAYGKVLTYQPDDYSSRLALSNLFSVQGRYDEALQVTKQPLFSEKPVDIPLLYQCCELLRRSENWLEYAISAKALLLTDMIYTQHYKEIMCMISSKSLRTRLDNLKCVQREFNIDPTIHRQKSIGNKLDSAAMLKIFLRYINVIYHITKDYQELRKICFSAYTCSALECYESSIDFYTSVACICTDNKEFTYNHLKILASRNHDNNQTWNLLSIAMSNIYKDLRHHRFCLRQSDKNPEVLALVLFKGHNNLMSGSYKQALEDYMIVFCENPNDSFVVFCIALTFLSLSCQRYVSSKYLCLFQMIAFLHTYLELRGSCQETMFNIGRVFHQMSMLDKAVIFYKMAISKSYENNITKANESEEDFDEIFNIRREAAFNLSLIYKNSQSYALAHQVIKDNFTI